MTVEAAFVMPFFLLIMIGFLYLIPYMQFNIRLQLTMEEFTQKAAVYSYAEESVLNSALTDSFAEDEQILAVVQGAGIRGAVYALVMSEYKEKASIAGVSGIQTLYSDWDREDDIVDAVVCYTEQVKGMPLPVNRLSVLQRSRRRLWTGTSLIPAETDSQEQIVYITENGSVYHEDPYCTYLKLSVVYQTMEQIEKGRNKSGEIYRPCERCRPSADDYGAYITLYGNRYHNSASCPGISRNIMQVPLSSVGNLPPCSKCGGG